MNSTKQFWALCKFQITINPFIWFSPVAFGIPLFIPLITGSFTNSYHSGLDSLLMIQNLFFVGMIGAFLVAPDKFQFGNSNLVSSYTGSEFLLTRAIDRPVLYRVKSTLFYFLILMMPLAFIFNSLRAPDLTVSEYSKTVQQQFLEYLPGSTPVLDPDHKHLSLFLIPGGNVLVAEWQLWVFLITVITVQLLIVLLYPFKYAKFGFWTIIFGTIFLPLFMNLHAMLDQAPTPYEKIFFFFASHQLLFWTITSLTLIFTHLWCERRYARLEL